MCHSVETPRSRVELARGSRDDTCSPFEAPEKPGLPFESAVLTKRVFLHSWQLWESAFGAGTMCASWQPRLAGRKHTSGSPFRLIETVGGHSRRAMTGGGSNQRSRAPGRRGGKPGNTPGSRGALMGSGHRSGLLRSILRVRLSVPTPPDTYFSTGSRGWDHERSLGEQGDGAQRSR